MRKKNGVWEFTNKDTWSLDETLSPVIAAGLKKFREVVSKPDNCAGLPSIFAKDHNLNTEEDADFEKAVQLWHACLDDMIYAFDTPEPEYEGEFVDGPNHMEKSEAGYRWDVRPKSPELWEKYTEELRLHNERVRKGTEAFGRYYKTLWW